jgi:hypothetical protein
MLKHIFGDRGAQQLIQHPRLHSYIVTARGRGLNSSPRGRRLWRAWAVRRWQTPQAVRCCNPSSSAWSLPVPRRRALPLQDFDATMVRLREDTVARALHASGSIPFVLEGEQRHSGGSAGPLLGRRHHRLSLRYAAFPRGTAHPVSALSRRPHPRLVRQIPALAQKSAAVDGQADPHLSECRVPRVPAQGKIPDRSDFRRMSPRRNG